MEFDFDYNKPKNRSILTDLTLEPISLKDCQFYNPIYNTFFELNETNANSILLNHNYTIENIIKQENNNEIKAKVVDASGNLKDIYIFTKFSPLLDPVKYLAGKYDLQNQSTLRLPFFGSTTNDCHKKVLDPDNAAYIDAFFSFLSSKLLHHHGIVHGIDCYGWLLGIKSNFYLDIVDDLEYLANSTFFRQQDGTIFKIENEYHSDLINHDSRSKKRKLKFASISNNNDNRDEEFVSIEFSDVAEIETLNSILVSSEDSHNINIDTKVSLNSIELNKSILNAHIFKTDKDIDISNNNINQDDYDINNNVEIKKTKHNHTNDSGYSSSSSTCSSRSSNTCSENTENNHNSSFCGSESESEVDDDDECSNSTASDDQIMASIFNFPVQAIFLEKCEDTLDRLLADQDIDFGSEELLSALIQVIMTLIIYQKCFGMTHNDLHTNNVMFIPTEKQFLFYKINNKHYKIPTFGRIFKIIDFGRAIYKFRGNLICSDSFQTDGDAHSQYNFGKHFNEERPRLEPNFSFDLCRLGCSIIDFLIDELDDLKKTKCPVTKLIAEWCQDDKGKNILWKSNGEERYPGFKLYKMISRTVSKHTPLAQLERPIIDRYVVNRKTIKKTQKIINIDTLPSYL